MTDARILSVEDADLRFGDWGPGYLSTDDDAAFGVVVLRPGDVFANHLHEHHTESFLALEGAAEIWLDRTERIVLSAGQLLHARPGVEHLVRNPFDAPFRAVFVKTPWADGDKIDRPWEPGATG
ncbi:MULTISPECIES: cupin domain-containing protein [Microbacterium]|uniref:Cupin domain-containing protein n=1 Tax=Microbacterium resistens TaxID=156977 RepID=A0ABY3RPT0_9MICO|nr:cupin domain-containing protein [Microbacterium resistens]MBW1640591.1 cupin domain-containing protein [Microbacterium resistens]MDA4890703.1 cupin domain-containing protein [Streptomyces sp. MS2A]UGS26027.1 cupin domain-containing protein [Microbacterium resistens]